VFLAQQVPLVLSDLQDPAYVAQGLQVPQVLLAVQQVLAQVPLVQLVLVPLVRLVLVGYLDPCLFTS
jgi:hypothetical protein